MYFSLQKEAERDARRLIQAGDMNLDKLLKYMTSYTLDDVSLLHFSYSGTRCVKPRADKKSRP